MTDEPSRETRAQSKDDREEEYRKAYGWLQPQPMYADHYTAAIFSSQGVLRIAFGEWVGSGYPAIYRIGITLPLKEARRLNRTLTRLLKEEDERLAAIQVKAASSEASE